MKKIFYSILMGGLMLISATSCKDSFEDDSVITYYVDLQLEGKGEMYVAKGTKYEEPGYSAYIQDDDVTSKVVIKGEVNTNEVGYYPLTYSAVNNDGFITKKTRKVFVYDAASPADDYSGKYQSKTAEFTPNSGDKVDYKGYSITLKKVCQGIYEISDFYGGYYAQHLGKGSNSAFSGYAYVNSNKEVSCIYPSLPDAGIKSLSGSINNNGGSTTFAETSETPSNPTYELTLNVENGDGKFDMTFNWTEKLEDK